MKTRNVIHWEYPHAPSISRFFVKNNGSFVGVQMDGTICHAHNINFAYTLDTLEEAQKFAQTVSRMKPDGQTEITDKYGNTINQ
jgi:hypothetical protein